MDILQLAERKLAIVFKDKNLTEEEKEIYFEIFIQDIVNNLEYQKELLRRIKCVN